jgi:DNA-3-methyladenine glycosylase I
VARYGEKKRAELLANAGIVRNHRKIDASISNAVEFLKLQKEYGSFSEYLWGFTKGKPITGKWKSLDELPPRTELSDRVSADLKKRGFRFLGSIIIYSHMQAVGLVNDHIMECFRYGEIKKLGRDLPR